MIVLQLNQSSILDRVAITLGLFIGLFVVFYVLSKGRNRLEAEKHIRVANVGIVVVLLVLLAITSSMVFSIWEIAIFELFGIQNPIILITQLVLTIFLLLGAYLLTGAVKRVVLRFTEDRASITKHQTETVFMTVQVILYILAVIIVFGIWQINLGGLLVGAGFLGIVVGLAARQTLGSLLAGFVLMFSRPFEIGDWVKIGERDGIVTEISMVNTRIQTADGEYVMIPNDNVASTEIINRTRKGRLRLRVEVGVDYDTDITEGVEIAETTVRELDDVLTVPQPQVVVTEFANSAILLEIRCWIDKPSARRRIRAQSAIIRSVKSAFDEAGIKIPYPQRELSSREFEIRSNIFESSDSPQDTAPK